jgi:hypothetical protein
MTLPRSPLLHYGALTSPMAIHSYPLANNALQYCIGRPTDKMGTKRHSS